MVDDHSTKAVEGSQGQIFRALAARSTDSNARFRIRRHIGSTHGEERLGLSLEPWVEWYWTERLSVGTELREATRISVTHGGRVGLKKCH